MQADDFILIVEDDPDWVNIIRSLLEGVGFSCLVSENYLDSIRILESRCPSVLVLDLNLGNGSFNQNEWDGWQLAEAAKERNVSSIVVTAYSQDYNFGRAFREFNAIDVFDKRNFDTRKAVFVQRVHEAVRKTKKRQEVPFRRRKEKNGLISPTTKKVNFTKVFISYSHEDRKWLEKFRRHLKVIERNHLITFWDDTKIQSGTKWRDEINFALSSAKVALLLVTPDFLASDFIMDNELPPLLEASKKKGLTILWVAIKPSLYAETRLSDFQAVNDPNKPLVSLNTAEAEQEIVEICKKVKEAIH